eukprot:TRINITY_DN3912_c0_g1_i2.p1 TRINITY_DN3912_c0_g1~~TRINITY_DN3912_c0_g1_i2.p1  ORF type:complete len:147 (+),score=56.51 TRINITY_DN3912_c0_g1_i2:151-591(+)
MSSSKDKAPEQKVEEANEEKAEEQRPEDETAEELKPPYVDPDTAFDDEEEGLAAERKALSFVNASSDNILPTKEYIEKTVLKLLLQALTVVAKERPENPVEFVAYYILKHNPMTDPIPLQEFVKEVVNEEAIKDAAKESEKKKCSC